MKRRFVKILLNTTIYIILFFTLSGCWNAKDINELFIVAGIGIDKADTPGSVQLTAQIAKPAEMKKPSKDGTGGANAAFWNIKSTSGTVFSAFREFTHETSNKMYLSHTQVIVFGKDAAKDGVRKYLDFFLRSRETRPSAVILVSGSTADEVLDIKPEIEKLPAMDMAKLSKAQEQLTAHALSVSLQEFTARLLSKTTSPIAPMVTAAQEENKKSLHVEGMAVFKEDKMAGTLDPSETRGLLWVLGKVKGGTIDVDRTDEKASLEILGAKSKITFKMKDGKPFFHVMITEKGSLTSQSGTLNLATPPGFHELEQLQNEAIRNEITDALGKAKELNADIFGFGDEIRKKNRSEWSIMEDKWELLFPELQVEIEVKSAIRAAGQIIKPAAPEAARERRK